MLRSWKISDIILYLPESVGTSEDVRSKINRALDSLDCRYEVGEISARQFFQQSETEEFWTEYVRVKRRLEKLREIDPDPIALMEAVRERWIATEIPPRKVTASSIDRVKELERDMIRAALLEADGVKARAAKILGIKRTTLLEKIRRMEKQCL